MKIRIVLLLTILSGALLGQSSNIDKITMDSIYNDALMRRIDLTISSSYKYIEMNEFTRSIKDNFRNPACKFLENEELIKIALRQKEPLEVHRVVHRFISADTIDINFGVLSLSAKRRIHFNKGLKFIKANFTLDCGGTEGYMPGIRFVLYPEKSIWIVAKNSFINEE